MKQKPPIKSISAPLPTTVESCHELIHELRQVVGVLLARVEVLEEHLRLDSRTSSKPPSSDGPGGGSDRSVKAKSGRKRGAQRGHKGHSRVAVPSEAVDHIVECAPPSVCSCGGEMRCHGKPLRHQVFELPPLRPSVTEYRRHGSRCVDCGRHVQAGLPLGVPRGQLGPRALALIGTLAGQFHLSQGKIKLLLEQILGLDFSVGAISQAHGKVADVLEPVCQELHQGVQQASVKHADETTHPSHGHRMWLWAMVCDWGASFRIDPSRGKTAAKQLLGEQVSGILVSDRYAGYTWVDVSQRQICWAHLIRDFRRIAGRADLPGTLGRSLLGMGLLMFRYRDQSRPPTAYIPLRRRFARILERGARQYQCSRTANTCANLVKLEPALWRFLEQPAVPPTNNLAERALRGVVLRRKISYATRSGRGLRFVERTFAVAYTCRQQGKALFHFLGQAFDAALRQKTAPSLVPGG